MADHKKGKPSVSIYEEKIDHNGDTNINHDTDDTKIAEDFENHPLKKPKCAESSVMDAPLPSPTISASSLISECSESIGTKLDDQINGEPLPTPPSPTKSTLSQVSKETISADDDKKILSADDDKQDDDKQIVSEDDNKQPDEPKHIINVVTYDYLPKDYTISQQDECAHYVIEDSSEEEVLVKIEDISVKQRYLVCLLDKSKWVDDEVISAYIACMKDQIHLQNDAQVYFENPFVTRLLKRDSEHGIHGPTSMTNIVKNYLNHDMIHLPINIKDSHWYLACINVEKTEIQVLDSLCWEHSRADLNITLQGLQYHLEILKSQGNLSNCISKDLNLYLIIK